MFSISNPDAVNPVIIILVIGKSVAWPQEQWSRENMGIEGQSVIADEGQTCRQGDVAEWPMADQIDQ